LLIALDERVANPPQVDKVDNLPHMPQYVRQMGVYFQPPEGQKPIPGAFIFEGEKSHGFEKT
jgi:hypothetical protein